MHDLTVNVIFTGVFMLYGPLLTEHSLCTNVEFFVRNLASKDVKKKKKTTS